MNKSTIWFLVAVVLLFAGIFTTSKLMGGGGSVYSKYDITQVIPADENTGGFPEMTVGEADAPVALIEYTDYQCSACASINPLIEDLVEEYDGKLVVVYRTSQIMPSHMNSNAAMKAALAAYNQGVWAEFKDALFENQSDWFYSDSTLRQSQFEGYFLDVTDDKGDLDKFRQDIESDEVAKKVNFDAKITERQGVEWTPYFVLNGEVIAQASGEDRSVFIDRIREKIDAALAAKNSAE